METSYLTYQGKVFSWPCRFRTRSRCRTVWSLHKVRWLEHILGHFQMKDPLKLSSSVYVNNKVFNDKTTYIFYVIISSKRTLNSLLQLA
jgi:hypothetical protein